MYLVHSIFSAVSATLKALYNDDFQPGEFQINQTKPEFEGDYTVVLFSLLKKTRKPPAVLGQELGEALLKEFPALFSSFNVISGFLNLTISDVYWSNFLRTNINDQTYGSQPAIGKKVMVEYSSPNTNKPLHLGHLRNNFLGWSIAAILEKCGYEVIKTSVVNDRGVHICKSMYAWQQFALGATPENTGMKGDHLVGDYYVKFEELLKTQAAALLENEKSGNLSHYDIIEVEKVIALQQQRNKLAEDVTEKNTDRISKVEAELLEMRRAASPAMKEVKQMLLDWEAGKTEVISLWNQMNSWVYKGMDETYKAIGSDFDKTYYESNTYLTGKTIVAKGLEKSVFFKKDDGSVWIDLTSDGLDEKLVLRKDGTSVYITQDIGLAQQKYDEYKIDKSIYVIGDEQNYHMKVLQLICKKLGLPYASDIQHLSYGMVELPEGKMKSREGTVVDADDIVAEMENEARKKTEELGKVQDFKPEDLENLYHTIGVGALKFFLLRVDPKKKMVFNPAESIDFHGFTAPFIQFNYARIKSILRKEQDANSLFTNDISFSFDFLPLEKELVTVLERYPATIAQAGDELNPSAVASYAYLVAKTFSSFYAEHSIANAESPEKKHLRLLIAGLAANVIADSMRLLGIGVPERM